LLRQVADVIAPGERILLGLEDTPTQREGHTSKGRVSITTRPRARPTRSSSTDISGSRSPGWLTTPAGGRSACPSAPCSTSAPRTSAG
jgi:hypothetical protein